MKRCLHECKYRESTTRCKCLIILKNREAGLDFRKHLYKPVQFWNEILWTHETKMNLWQNDWNKRVWSQSIPHQLELELELAATGNWITGVD